MVEIIIIIGVLLFVIGMFGSIYSGEVDPRSPTKRKRKKNDNTQIRKKNGRFG